MEKLENQMSNVKEAYNWAFGPQGSKSTNRVLNSLYKKGLPDKLDLLGVIAKDTQYLTAGDFPFTIETFKRLNQ